MGFFRKKATAVEIGNLLANSIEIFIDQPADEFFPQFNPFENVTRRKNQTITDYLVDNTPLTRDQARFEILCYAIAIYDFAIQSNVPDAHHNAIYNGFYPVLEDALQQWIDTEPVHMVVKERVEGYWEALQKGQLPTTGTPAIARTFLEVCESGQEGSIKDYLSFIMQATVLFRIFFEMASNIIKKFKIV